MSDLRSDDLRCELCDTPYTRAARKCDYCWHRLGSAVDLSAMRHERHKLWLYMALSVLASFAIFALSAWVFAGQGFVVVAAPIGLFFYSAVRSRAISKRLLRS
jgi:hypothetical protein